VPLVVVAGTFFLPMAQACDHGVSPLKYIAEDHDALATIWIAPTFAVAAVLAIAVMRSWRAKAKNALAFAVMGAFALTLPVWPGASDRSRTVSVKDPDVGPFEKA